MKVNMLLFVVTNKNNSTSLAILTKTQVYDAHWIHTFQIIVILVYLKIHKATLIYTRNTRIHFLLTTIYA